MGVKLSPEELVRELPPDASAEQFLEEMSNKDPLVFAMFYRRLKKKPYVFDLSDRIPTYRQMVMSGEMSKIDLTKQLIRHRPFLIQPLRDQHPSKWYRKSRQVGVSELSLTESLWFLKAHPFTKLVYTFPRSTQLEDFSKSRIHEALQESPRMKGLLTGTEQVMTKKIGDSWMFLRSAWESNLGEGIDLDMVIFDEKDRMRPGVEHAFTEGLKSSPYGYSRYVSTPSLPGRGVDEGFQKSDQMFWFVRCTKCGEPQTPTYPDNVMQLQDLPVNAKEIPPGTYRFACKKDTCRGELDRLSGEWVPKYPSRKNHRSYQITQLMAPWITADRIMQDKIDIKYQQLWTNYVLGLPSTGGTALVDAGSILNCVVDYNPVKARTKDWSYISVGIDWGHLNWVFVRGINAHNNKHYLLDIGIFEDQSDNTDWISTRLVNYLKAFRPDIIVADGGYGKDRNAILRKAFNTPRTRGKVRPQVVYSCDYNPAGPRSRTHQPVWSDADSRVLVERATEIKESCREIHEQRIGFFNEGREIDTLIAHFSALAPVIVENDGETYEDIDKTGEDHLAHSYTYSRIGMERILAGYQGFSFSIDGEEF